MASDVCSVEVASHGGVSACLMGDAVGEVVACASSERISALIESDEVSAGICGGEAASGGDAERIEADGEAEVHGDVADGEAEASNMVTRGGGCSGGGGELASDGDRRASSGELGRERPRHQSDVEVDGVLGVERCMERNEKGSPRAGRRPGRRRNSLWIFNVQGSHTDDEGSVIGSQPAAGRYA